MTFEGLGEMFEGDSADTIGGKFPLMLMGGQAEVLALADMGPWTPIGVSGNLLYFWLNGTQFLEDFLDTFLLNLPIQYKIWKRHH